MRKHFLLLFLMALLPLAGWAATTVTLYDFTVPYGTALTVDNLPDDAWLVTGDLTKDQVKAYLTFARVDDGSATWDSNNVGVYSWTLTKAADTGGNTIYLSSNNAKLTIAKADNAVTNTPTVSAGGDYNAAGYDLVATVPTVKFGTVKYNVTNSAVVPAADAAGWTTTAPHVAKPGTYYVYIMVDADDVNGNYNALAPQMMGAYNKVVITGSEIPAAEYTLPTALGAAIPFDNTAHPLATAGSLSDEHPHCTGIEYSLDEVEWSTSVPTATAALGYTVHYRILGIEGWYDKTGTVAATISPAAPTVYAATGATGLGYTGVAQELLSEAGSASIGATPTYSVKYSATNLDDWGAVLSEAKATKADVKGTDAGFYQITTLVAAGGNYLAAAATPIVVQIATKPALTAAPTAADLTWNNAAQQLIVAGEGTVAGKVLYQLETNGAVTVAWTDNIENIKATDATKEGNEYVVKYKVTADNFTPVAETAIANVKIKKKVLSVKANNVQKTYDGNANVGGDAAVVGGGAKFTFIGRVESTLNLDDAHVSYDAIDAANKTAVTHEGVLKATTASLNAISTNYDYTIIPGDLIINQKAITVSAKTGLNINYGADPAISGEYTVGGVVGGDDPWATGQAPVLTTNANAIKPEPGTYTVSFTKGTLKTGGDYKMSEDGENHDGYVIGTANFVVNPDPSSKIVITVLPKTQVYTGVAEDWSNMVPNTDYYVTGLIGSDQLKTAPTFTRSDATNFNVGTYTLTASGAAIDESIAGRYPGGIIYNNSTFEITPAELTATVNQQTVATGATALDQTAWTVTGLQGPDAEAADVKTLLGASLSFNTTEGDVADRADVTTLGTYNKGIMLSITNTNYQLKAGTEFGKLLVISATQFALNPNDVNLESELAVADFETSATQYEIVFDNIEMNIGEWYAMVLPFEVDPLKMVQAFDRYVIFNELNKDMTKDQNIKFTLSLNAIPAGTPFLIKFAPKTGDAANAVVDWNAANFTPATGYGLVKIDKDITPVVDDVITFTGTYTTKNLHYGYAGADVSDKVWWLAHNGMPKAGGGTYTDNNWKKPKTNAHDALPMEAYLYSESGWTTYAPNITVEDFDGQTTSIKSISVEQIHNMTVDGMYNLNGMKMQGVPTQKGVYIMNGKKVVIK